MYRHRHRTPLLFGGSCFRHRCQVHLPSRQVLIQCMTAACPAGPTCARQLHAKQKGHVQNSSDIPVKSSSHPSPWTGRAYGSWHLVLVRGPLSNSGAIKASATGGAHWRVQRPLRPPAVLHAAPPQRRHWQGRTAAGGLCRETPSTLCTGIQGWAPGSCELEAARMGGLAIFWCGLAGLVRGLRVARGVQDLGPSGR